MVSIESAFEAGRAYEYCYQQILQNKLKDHSIGILKVFQKQIAEIYHLGLCRDGLILRTLDQLIKEEG